MTNLNVNQFSQVFARGAVAGKINSAFEIFLENQINISTGIRSQAGASQKHIREFLRNESRRDSTFPRILEKNDSDFISGSFGRHTKTWPLDDIDLFMPVDGGGLLYWRNGTVTPNTVLSDGGITFNPLLGMRWAANNCVSSDVLIRGFSAILKRGYPQSDVAINGEAISVQLTIGASGESDGLKFDVVPCFRLDPHDGSSSFYLIPNGRNGWKHTNPRIDEETCTGLQSFHGRIYRKVIKLVKYWNNYQLNNALSSYYVELSIAKHFSYMRAGGQRITVLSEGVALAFSALRAARLAGDIQSPVLYAPTVELGVRTASDDHKLMNAFATSAAAVAHENAGRGEQAISSWKILFGPQFGN